MSNKLGLGVLFVVPALVMFIIFASGGGGVKGEDENKATGGAVPATVPDKYRGDVARAGSICSEVSPAAIAAQIAQESNWDPTAASDQGAQGIAQFIPSTWASAGKDGDGDGIADVMNPHDAIFSQGHFMCSLTAEMKELIDSGAVTGSVLNLALAAYNAGPGAVRKFGGIPPYPETETYIETITKAINAAGAGSAGGAVPADGSRASIILATARSKIGMPYVWGDASDATGYDCSGLVQTSYAAAGVTLPRTSAAQCSSGTRVSQDQAQPGDLVCWNGHVAIYAGEGMIVEAATEGVPVRETLVYTMAGGPYYVRID